MFSQVVAHRAWQMRNAHRLRWMLALVTIVVSLSLGLPHQAYAQGALTDPGVCYSVADNGGEYDADVLVRINRSTGSSTAIVGATGTFNIEAITVKPGGTTLYAMNGNQLGALDILTAQFTPIGTPLGTGQGTLGAIHITDLDGLTYDPFTNVLYASVVRQNTNDLLIRIDPTTGALIPFAAGVDYLLITVTGSPNSYKDIDDLAIDPITGGLYAISDNGGAGELVLVNKTTGVSAYIGELPVVDVEGLSFFNDGQLYASDGVPGDPTANNLYRVDKTTAAMTKLGSLMIGGNDDFESLGCLTAAAYVAVDKTTNGVGADLAPGPQILVGAPVNWSYTLRNTGVITVDNISLTDDKLAQNSIICPAFPQPNNGLAPGEQVVCNASGLATAGQYVNTATVVGNAEPTVGFSLPLSSTDVSHYFGVQPDLVITKDDGGITSTPGSTVIYTLVYSNVGTIDASGVEIHETVPANTTFVPGSSSSGWSCTPSNAAGSTCTLFLGPVSHGQRSSVDFAVALDASWPLGITQIQNTAQIQDDGLNGPEATPANNTASDTTPVLAAPVIEADKFAQWKDTGTIGGIDPNEVITYTIVVRNIGNQVAINVPVVDNPDPNSTLIAGTVTISGGTGTVITGNTAGDKTISAQLASIPGNGGQVKIIYRVTINNPLPNGADRIINHALVSNTIPLSTTVPTVATPDLTIFKSDGGATGIPGNSVIYTLAYTNSGQRNATGVFLRETVPANTTFNAAASAPTAWNCADGSGAGTICVSNVGNLVVGGQGTAKFAVKVNAAIPIGIIETTNLARVGDDGTNGDDPTPDNNQSLDTTPINAAPDLAITKDDGGITTKPGGIVTYTLTYDNVGNQNATGVVITEVVPANTAFAPTHSTGGWLCKPNNSAASTCTLKIGSVAVGAGGAVKFAVKVNSTLPANASELDNQARIADDGRNGPDLNTINNTANDFTLIDAAPDLMIVKDDGNIGTTPGGLVIYTLNYQNGGTRGATNVVITDVVPANTTFVTGASQPTWSCANGSGAGTLCSINVGTLAVGASGTAKFAVRVNNSVPAGVTQISNLAGIHDDGENGNDPHPEDNVDGDTTPLNAAPDLVLSKTDGGITSYPTGVVTYTLLYNNIGNVGATGITIREVVPANSTFNAAASAPAVWSCANGSAAGTQCTITIGQLVAGASGAVKFAVTVVTPLPTGVTQLTNSAQIADDQKNGADPTPANNSASDTTPLVAAPKLEITKRAQIAKVRPGDPITYTLVYTNLGNVDATGVVVHEYVPDWTDFNSQVSTPGWSCAFDNTISKNVCSFPLGTLKAGQSSTAQLVFVVFIRDRIPASVTEIVNRVEIVDDGSKGPPDGGVPSATVSTPVERPTALDNSPEPSAPGSTHLFLPYMQQGR